MSRWNYKAVPFETLLGKTLVSVAKGRDDDNDDNDQIVFTTTEGERYRMFHEQDCCENVVIEDIVGKLAWLIGTPIVQAEEVSNSDEDDTEGEKKAYPEGWKPDKYEDGWTWTFYKLATELGYVTIRWHGTSNGYYSESVDFVLMNDE